MSAAESSGSNESKINPGEAWAGIMTEMLHQAQEECVGLLKRKTRKQGREAGDLNHLKGKREKSKRMTLLKKSVTTAGDCSSISISSVEGDEGPYTRYINSIN